MSIRSFIVGCCFLLLSPSGPRASAQANNNSPDEALRQQLESIEKQKLAIQRQIVPLRTNAPPEPLPISPLPVASQPDCPTLRSTEIERLVTPAARKYALQPALLRAVMKQESGFKPCAVSIKGAQGLMQLMPSTAQSLRVEDAFDPAQNVTGGAAYLKQMLTRYKGDLRLALIGYNAGPGRADQPAGAVYPAETNTYVARIFADLGLGQSDAPTGPDPIPEDSTSDGELPPGV